MSKVSVSGHDFSSLIIDLLNKSGKFDVVIMNSDFLDGGLTNGVSTNRMYNATTGKYEIWIELSNHYLSTATEISIARTILHETIHAYLTYSSTTDPTGVLTSELMRYATANGYTTNHSIHHEFMGQYVDAIGVALWSWDMSWGTKGQISLDYAKDVAWGGLTGYPSSSGWNYYDSFKEINSLSDIQRIENIINNEKEGTSLAKSEKCN